MKKSVTIIMLLILSVFCMTGCIRFRTTVKMDLLGRIDFSMLYAMTRSASEYSEDYSFIDEETLSRYLAEGCTVTPYEEDDFAGYIISRNNISAFDSDEFDDTIPLKLEGTRLILDIPWNMDDEDSYAYILDGIRTFILVDGGYAELEVTLPVRPAAHNATSVSLNGKTLTWNLLEMEDRDSVYLEISLVMMLLKIFRIVCFVVLAAACILFILVRIYERIRWRRGVQQRMNGYSADEPKQDLPKS